MCIPGFIADTPGESVDLCVEDAPCRGVCQVFILQISLPPEHPLGPTIILSYNVGGPLQRSLGIAARCTISCAKHGTVLLYVYIYGAYLESPCNSDLGLQSIEIASLTLHPQQQCHERHTSGLANPSFSFPDSAHCLGSKRVREFAIVRLLCVNHPNLLC
jgi:hypothetical protein